MTVDEQPPQPKTRPDALGWWWVWYNEAWWPCQVLGDGTDPHFWKRVIFRASWGPSLHEMHPGMLWFRAQLPTTHATQTEADGEWPGHFLQLNEAERQASWPEDFVRYKDNGAYLNGCCYCGCRFVGHKRRVVCRTCEDQHQSRCRAELAAQAAVERLADAPDTT